MKKFEFLNFRFSYELKRKKYDESEYFSDDTRVKNNILYIAFTLFLIVFSLNISFFKDFNAYKVGTVLQSNIYSPKTISFHNKFERNKLIENLLNTMEKEYIFVSGVNSEVLNNFSQFSYHMRQYRKTKLSDSLDNFKKSAGLDIPHDLIEHLRSLSNQNFEKEILKFRSILLDIYKNGVYEENHNISIDTEIESKIKSSFTLDEQRLIWTFVKPNYIYDRDKTEKSFRDKLSKIPKEKTKIEAGELVLTQGKTLTEEDLNFMSILGIYTLKIGILRIFLNFLYLLGVSILFFYYNLKKSKEYFLNKNKYKAQILMYIGLFSAFYFFRNGLIYIIPISGFVLLGIILFSERFAFSQGAFALLFALPFFNYNLKFLVVYIITFVVLTGTVKTILTRIDLVHLGIKIGVLSAFNYLILSYFTGDLYREDYFIAFQILLACSISGMVAIAILPYFEKTFNLMTVFSLLELSDLSHPLLKEFSVIAPGSFQHSLMVATLSENAAETIGANSIFARVASYYHDIGKMKRAHYYVENLSNGENPHNDLSPTMSTTILKAHTKEGVEIGKKYGIQKEIRDIMTEHQGTTLIAYFYNKAKQEDDTVNMSDFRYPGPIPKSRESAIIMLADSIEAAVRSLTDKNQDSVDKLIRKIISTKIEENQLADANLTFREIELIIQSFKKTLTSIHHLRVKYPDLNK